MGIALIIPGADFSANNLGTITFEEDVAIAGLSINVNQSYSGQTFTPTVSYTPATTNQKGVTWEITSGNTYATINSTTGVVTILSVANSSDITIKATSSYDNTITSTVTTSVTWVDTPVYPTALTISGSSTVTGQSSQYTISYTPVDANQLGVTWSITTGGTYATIDTNTGLLTILSGASASAVVIKATSTADTSVSATKSITVTYEVAQIGRKAIFAYPYDSADATAVSAVNPISGKYWNKMDSLTNHYAAAATFKDTAGTNWISRLNQNNNDKPTALLSQLTSTYIDTTTYTNTYLGLGSNPKNAYTYVNGLTANSNYDSKLFTGYNHLEETNTPKCHPFAILSVPTGATFTIRIYIAASTSDSDDAYNSQIKFGANSVVASNLGSAPANPLVTPSIILTGVTPDTSGYILLYALIGNVYVYTDISLIEIERTA